MRIRNSRFLTMRKTILLLVTACVSLLGQNQGAGAAPSAGQEKGAPGAQGAGGRGAAAGRGLQNLLILPEKTAFAEILPTMETFQVSLGVQCTFCHVQGNFARDDNPRKNVARAMMRIVDQFNKTFPDGKQRIGCWSCH